MGIDEGALDEAAELLLTRNIRLKINRHLMKDNEVPDDPEKLDFLMANLRDMDKSSLARKKIKSDEQVAAKQNESISLVTSVLQTMRGGHALPPVEIIDVEAAAGEAPVLPSEFDRTEFVQGEQQIGTISEDIDQFRARMHRQSGE